MLTKTEIHLRLPDGACFSQAPSLFVYRRILQIIQRISCLQTGSRCNECPLHSSCRYDWITGHHFQKYPGILCPADPFEKRKYSPGEELVITILWIGTAEMYKSAAEIALDEMKQSIQGIFFYNKKISHSTVSETPEQMSELRLKTPVRLPEQTDLSENELVSLFEEMNDWYQSSYGCTFLFSPEDNLSKTGQSSSSLSCSIGSVILPTKVLRLNGITGTQTFSDPVTLSSVWKQIGIGATNCIGGGAFETDHTI